MTPSEVVQSQLEAYNRKDIEAWSSTYSNNAIQLTTDGTILAEGREQIKQNIISRFREPDLFAELIDRKVYDNVVVDHEVITRNFSAGLGTVEMLCIYTIENSYIVRGEFKLFGKKLTRRSS